MALLVLLRHGESVWNAANRFTGWTDVELSEKGEQEAADAGRQLADTRFDVCYTSDLVRAQKTAEIVLALNSASDGIPTHEDWRLNERHYGALQGLDKDETRAKHGAEQVHIWRRSYDVAPPDGESLKACAERTIPCFDECIIPDLTSGKNVLVAAHGNSLRSIVMHIEDISSEDIVSLEIPTGEPIHFTYDKGVITRDE